jgi:hypothetical protein
MIKIQNPYMTLANSSAYDPCQLFCDIQFNSAPTWLEFKSLAVEEMTQNLWMPTTAGAAQDNI